jgi:thymidylate kinase
VRNVEEPQKYLFRKFHGGACISAIHVHEQIAWFVGFLDDDQVWARKRPSDDDPDVTIPSPEDAILINLAHACYENKELRFNDVLRVRHAMDAAAGELDWEYLLRVADARGWRDGLAFLLLVQAGVESTLFGGTLIPDSTIRRLEALVLRDGPVWKRLARLRDTGVIDLPLDLSYPFCKRLYYRKVLADPRRTRWQRLGDTARTLVWGVKLKSRIRPQAGFIVSFSGTDGSGKSTHARALSDALRLCELKVVESWSRGGSTGALAKLGAIWNRGAARSASAPTLGDDPIERRRRKLAHPVVRFSWAWLVALDQLATSYRQARWPAMRGRIVVLDRYVYDTAVELDASLPRDAAWSRLAIAALLRLAPRPDLAFVLDVSLPTAQQRKPHEIWHSSFDQERRCYRALAETHGLRVVSVEGDFAESNDRVVRETVMTYMGEFATRLNALFLSNPHQRNAPDPVWARGGTR